MERAVDPALLALALGQHTSGELPSAAELTEMIASIEIALVRGVTNELDSRLEPAAWYLHGIASSSIVANAYSPERQARAFAVSAHAFDLLLNQPDLDDKQRLALAFAAQVGYHRADLTPNSTAIYRRMREELGAVGEPGLDLENTALRLGIAFLGLDHRGLSGRLRSWRTPADQLAVAMGRENLVGTMFGPTSQIVLGVGACLSFLRLGDRAQLEIGRAALASVVSGEAGPADLEIRWVASHLLRIAEGMGESSIWAVLPPGTPPAVAQSFTFGTPPVLTLWPPQRELLASARLNPLSPSSERLFISVPTSAGKTLLAQLIVCSHLANASGSVCYVTPLRSLGREMRQAMRTRLAILNRKLASDLPDAANETWLAALGVDAEPPAVDIMTPERLMNAIRRDPASTLSRYSLFIVDEALLIAQSSRGFLLEDFSPFWTRLGAGSCSFQESWATRRR